MLDNIVFNTLRLQAYMANLHNKKYVIDLYNQKDSKEFLEGIDGELDFKLAMDCYDSHQNLGSYLFFENESKNFVGFGGVQRQEPMLDGTLALEDEIEFLIMVSKQFAGFGYAYEFSSIFLEKFFSVFPDLTVPARVNKENIACIKLLQKLGFIYEREVGYRHYNNKFNLFRVNSNSFKSKESKRG